MFHFEDDYTISNIQLWERILQFDERITPIKINFYSLNVT